MESDQPSGFLWVWVWAVKGRHHGAECCGLSPGPERCSLLPVGGMLRLHSGRCPGDLQRELGGTAGESTAPEISGGGGRPSVLEQQ